MNELYQIQIWTLIEGGDFGDMWPAHQTGTGLKTKHLINNFCYSLGTISKMIFGMNNKTGYISLDTRPSFSIFMQSQNNTCCKNKDREAHPQQPVGSVILQKLITTNFLLVLWSCEDDTKPWLFILLFINDFPVWNKSFIL